MDYKKIKAKYIEQISAQKEIYNGNIIYYPYGVVYIQRKLIIIIGALFILSIVGFYYINIIYTNTTPSIFQSKERVVFLHNTENRKILGYNILLITFILTFLLYKNIEKIAPREERKKYVNKLTLYTDNLEYLNYQLSRTFFIKYGSIDKIIFTKILFRTINPLNRHDNGVDKNSILFFAKDIEAKDKLVNINSNFNGKYIIISNIINPYEMIKDIQEKVGKNKVKLMNEFSIK